jgi:hypothetical protein
VCAHPNRAEIDESLVSVDESMTREQREARIVQLLQKGGFVAIDAESKPN